MAPELFRVERVDEWPALPGGSTVWIIKGETIEDIPRGMTLKTTDQWKAALCDQIHKHGALAWVTWQDSFKGDAWLRTVERDETEFTHEDDRADTRREQRDALVSRYLRKET